MTFPLASLFPRFAVLALFGVAATAGAQETAPAARQAFLKLIDRPRVPLAGEAIPWVDMRGGKLEKTAFSFVPEAGQRVPGVMVRPKNPMEVRRLPVVIFLHGTGDSKEGMEFLQEQFALRGFLGVAIDGRYHGERVGDRADAYEDAILRAWETGKEHPFLYDEVWDVMRLIDYLESRPDVDPARIGVMGISKGGMETYLAAAVDPRIAVAAPCIGVQSFGWALEHNAWQARIGTIDGAVVAAAKEAGVKQLNAAFVRRFFDRVAPGIYGKFDGPQMLPLIAPRPLLVVNGDSDALTPVPGLMECINAARQAYAKAGVPGRTDFILEPHAGHQITSAALESVEAWFVKWLKP